MQADAAIARAVRLAPDAPEVIRTLGAYAQFGYNDYARAEVQYQKVLRLQPNNSDAILDLGRVQASQRRWLEALDNFRKAAELDQGNLGTLNHRLCAVRRWDEAIAVRQRIVALKNTPAERWELALDIFAATGSTRDIDEFVDRLTPAERDSAPFVPMQKERAIIRGEFAEWKRLDALVPIEASIWGRQPSEQAVDAALVFAAHGDLTGARARLGSQPAELRSTLERDPANARLWDTLARMEALLGEKEAAVRDARKAAELSSAPRGDGLEGQRRLNLAMVYALMGDKGPAVTELSGALSGPLSRFGGLPISVHLLRVDPAFANLRGDPAFEALLNDPKNHAPLF